MMTIFGQRAGPGMLGLVSQGSGALVALRDELRNSNGEAQDMANTMERGLMGALRQLKSVIEEVAISFYKSGLSDFLMGVVEYATNVVRAFGRLDPAVMKLILQVGGIALAVGPVLIVFGKLLTLVGFLMSPIGALVTLFTLFGVRAYKLGGILAAVYLIVKDFGGAFKRMVDAIRGFSGASELDGFGVIGQNIIAGLLKGIIEGGAGVIKTVIDLVKRLVVAFKSALGIESPSTVFYFLGHDIVQGLINGIKSKVREAVDALRPIWNGFNKATTSIHGIQAMIVASLALGRAFHILSIRMAFAKGLTGTVNDAFASLANASTDA